MNSSVDGHWGVTIFSVFAAMNIGVQVHIWVPAFNSLAIYLELL